MIEKISMKGRTDVSIMVAMLILRRGRGRAESIICTS